MNNIYPLLDSMPDDESYTFMQLVDMKDDPLANQEAVTEALHIKGRESYERMKNGTAERAEKMSKVLLFTFCSIRDCKLPAESIRALKIPLCLSHQQFLIKAIEERL
jgi:hypothetical protein